MPARAVDLMQSLQRTASSIITSFFELLIFKKLASSSQSSVLGPELQNFLRCLCYTEGLRVDRLMLIDG